VKIYIEYPFQGRPWGGGNQFLKALNKQFSELKHLSGNPELADIMLSNAYQNKEQVSLLKSRFPKTTCTHRTDGLYNKPSDRRQEDVFSLNQRLANYTIFQTKWAKPEHINCGLPLNRPHYYRQCS
jgi:hypothetical protein